MSSESILEYPALFDSKQIYDLDQLSLEYLDMVARYPGEADLKNVRSHLHKFLHSGLKVHTDLRDRLSECKSLVILREIVSEMQTRRRDASPRDKITWYYRYWAGMGCTPGETATFSTEDWNSKIHNDPLFNKSLKELEKKKSENKS
jgi:hypothetical protein